MSDRDPKPQAGSFVLGARVVAKRMTSRVQPSGEYQQGVPAECQRSARSRLYRAGHCALWIRGTTKPDLL